MEITLRSYTNWASIQTDDNAVCDVKSQQAVSASADFLASIRAEYGAASDDVTLPAVVREALKSAEVDNGKPLSARSIKTVSQAMNDWSQAVNRVGNRIMDSSMSADEKRKLLDSLTDARTNDKLLEIEAQVIKFGLDHPTFSGSVIKRLPLTQKSLPKDSPFPVLGDPNTVFTQSSKANTCFALSVINGCSRSKKIADHFNALYGPNSQAGQLKLYTPTGYKQVEIRHEYSDAKGDKLCPFENSVINAMCEIDPDYQKQMLLRVEDSGFPLGEATLFGQALGLVRNQPDVVFTLDKDVKLDDAKSFAAKTYDEVKAMISKQLAEGGVVTLNKGRSHYVTITEIKGDIVTIVDSLSGNPSGTFDLRAFSSKVSESMSGCYTFSFLALPDEEDLRLMADTVKDFLNKDDALKKFMASYNPDAQKEKIEELSNNAGLEIKLDSPEDLNAAIESVRNQRTQLKNDKNDDKKNVDKNEVNKKIDDLDALETAIVQLGKARKIKALLDNEEHFNTVTSEFIKRLSETPDGRQLLQNLLDHTKKSNDIHNGFNDMYDGFMDYCAVQNLV